MVRCKSARSATPRATWAGAASRWRAATASSTPATWWSCNEGRYYFRGRSGGIINVGGLKVYPEEVEAVLNADPRVRMSLVRARRNPITGAVVVADVVLRARSGHAARRRPAEQVKSELLECLPARAAGAQGAGDLRFVPRARD